jgi:hypothetical protein
VIDQPLSPSAPSAGTIGEQLQQLAQAEGVDLLALLEASTAGDTVAQKRATAFMRGHPQIAELLVAHAADLRTTWLSLSARSPISRVALQTRADAIGRDLATGTPSPLQELVIERVILCWLQLYLAEIRCVDGLKSNAAPHQTEFYDRMADRAHRRYLAAIRSLAQVRRLELPVLTQLNVATSQVNIATTGQSD